MYIKNERLFGQDWIFLKRPKYGVSKSTTSFIDNLQLINNETIKLMNCDEIDKSYHSEILESEYLLLLNEERKEIKSELIAKQEKFIFDDIEEIKLPISSSKETNNAISTINIYVKTPNDDNFILLKQIKV